MKKVLITMLVIAFVQFSYCQNYKFGKVSKEELEEQYYPLDSTANAAYLFKKRRTFATVLGNEIKLITEVQVRMKIYNQEGFDWATEEISLFGESNSDSEKVSNLKAVTYNLENGEIEETKLDKNSVFKETKSSSWKVSKFTMPNLKEGSVLEWTYKIYSPYFTHIDDIQIQYEIPVKNYETKIQLLEWFNFNKRQKGYYPFKITESSKRNSTLNTNDKTIEIIEKNIPALKEEPYVNSMKNYAASLQLEVASLSAPTLGLFENYATSWEGVAKDIFKSSSFGGELKKTGHLKDDMVQLNAELTTLPAKIGGALQYVKSKIKWNGNYSQYAEKGLRKAYNDGSGNIGDINLTLVAVLRELGVDANPALVSTRNNGVPLFPTRRGFNYVIAVAETDQGKIMLDASEKYSLPNVLPLRAMNWNATIVRKNGSVGFVKLGSSIASVEESNLNYKISEDGLIEGMNRVKYENLSAIGYRNSNDNLNEEDWISKIEQKNNDIEILNFRVTNMDNISKPVLELYKFEKEDGVEVIGDKMYLSPLLFKANDENPFKLENREYPIDFGAPWDEKIMTSIEIPVGFKVESLPEDLAIGMTDEMGVFVYKVETSGNKIQLSSMVKINKGIVPANYYLEMKEFFKQIVTKQTEKIVLSKS
ncbi:DUF3857 domain-containing protein [Urechidicola croceus]|uniref:DUF3857 domain-containing protein n=1 Tax=Urechidicola croceus TaxID=1850246 RepID=A0A1D8P7M0_9FLAO|nr:DUF3857 domain-containing protein [Urechidicola croceus]AOW20551.1 hypothetical protein LPB138_07605 [Urechidicola croceus]